MLGARPQFVKAAAVSRAIKCLNKNSQQDVITETIIHTGQHYDDRMSEVFFRELGIPCPTFNLGVGNEKHGVMTGKMIEAITPIVSEIKPDLLLVYGDTNSTLAGALAGARLKVKLAHIEAGLRSYRSFMPEEINRVITDRLANFLFCPSTVACKNLQRENVSGDIVFVGDVMFDAALHFANLSEASVITQQLNLINKNYGLCTIHRAENADDTEKMDEILAGLLEISCNTKLIFSVHPRIKEFIQRKNALFEGRNIVFVEPLSYLDFTKLLIGCDFVVTDSGGVQKEAFFHKKSCITVRDETEWVETVELGANSLCAATAEDIFSAWKKRRNFNFFENPYGDGKASEKILSYLLREM